MTTTNEADVTKMHILNGKANYFEWRRFFDRAAKVKDLWKIVSGSVTNIQELAQDSYLVYSRAPKVKKVENGGEVTVGGILNWQVAYKKWEKQQARLKDLRQLVLDTVSSSISLELEDKNLLDTPVSSANHLVATYGMPDERARAQLLGEANNSSSQNATQ
jgi:hypothetical protein